MADEATLLPRSGSEHSSGCPAGGRIPNTDAPSAAVGRFYRQVPLLTDDEKWLRGRIGEHYRPTQLLELRASLEERKGRRSVKSGWEPQGGHPTVEEVSSDRLRHHATPRGYLVEVQVLEAMLKEQRHMSILQIRSNHRLGEIGKIPVEQQPCGDQ